MDIGRTHAMAPCQYPSYHIMLFPMFTKYLLKDCQLLLQECGVHRRVVVVPDLQRMEFELVSYRVLHTDFPSQLTRTVYSSTHIFYSGILSSLSRPSLVWDFLIESLVRPSFGFDNSTLIRRTTRF
jgi:hypothetical protein